MSLVAIVGRPNVGKSTLFNRLVGMRQAIVDETAGVTRDRHYGQCEWCGTTFSVVDTGGYTSNSEDVFEEEIRKQVMIAIEEADVILFLVEVGTGITDFDEEIADILRRSAKPVLLVVHAGVPRIAIVGRPNAGKSSITNAFLGEERNIVTPVAGTTRDAVESYYNKFGHEFILVDTAGLRKKTKVSEDLEFYSVMRAIRAIEHSDVCILMIDAQYGVEAQDMAIFNLILKNSKGCVVAVNKWDLIENKTNNTMKEYAESIRKRLAPFSDIPVIFTSVIKKQRILDVLDAAAKVWSSYSRKIPTSTLNEVMLEEIENYPPPSTKGKFIKIKYVTQLPTPCPSFAFFCNLPQYIGAPYKRYLENKLRSHFDFTGCPIRIFMRQK